MIKIIRAFKTKIYPTKKQKIYFNKCFGIRRFAWNWGLENWNLYNSKNKLDKAWNHNQDFIENKPYLYQVNSMIKKMAFKNLEEAFKKYYKKEANRPKFKSKKRSSNAFSMNMKNYNTIIFKNRYFNINTTKKLGRFNIKSAENLNFLNDKNIKICEFTISEKNKNYYISIIYERTNLNNINIIKPINKIGIDAGIKTIMTCYDSKNKFYEFNLPKKILKLENQIDYYNRKLSRKKYKSNRYNLLRLKINKLYEKVYNIKKDFIFKISNYLSKTYNIINFESFNFKLANNLKRSRRKLYRIAIYTLLEVLKYKTKEYNTKLNLIRN